MKFIDLPLKQGSPVDWATPLKSYLQQIYGSSADFDDSIREFDRLRNDAVTSSKDEIGKELYYRYYGQLELLELRIQMDILNIEFTWHDAFDKSSKTKQHSVAFEKACILFNLASLLSYLAGEAAYTDEDLKKSYQYFQQSAGAFQFIQENFMHAPSDDMTVESVKAFTKLMVAQAQEAFLLKYLGSGVTIKNTLCAKLAQATSNLYGAAHDLTQAVKYIPEEEDDFSKLKQMYYQSVAHHYSGKSQVEEAHYGDAIASFQAAQSDLEGYRRYLSSYWPELIEIMAEHMEMVKIDLKTTDKDNDFIYHQTVPKLPMPVKPLDSAKPVPLAEQKIDQIVGKDLFEKIIPMTVHEKSSLYSEQKAQVLRDEEDHCSTAEQEFKSTLEFLKLPQALVELRELSDPDASLEADIDPRILAIASELSRDNQSSASADRLKTDVSDLLQRCDRLFADEHTNFQKLKAQFGAKWTQEEYPSALLDLQEQLGKAKKSLADASESDAKIQKLYDDSGKDIEILKLGPSNPKFIESFKQDLSSQMSLLDFDSADSSSIKPKLQEIDDKLQELRRLQKERDNTLGDLKKQVRNDDIENLLVLNKDKSDAEALFAQELQKFKPYQERIVATVDRQSSLTEELKQLMASVLDDPSVKSSLKRRDQQKGTIKSRTTDFLVAYDNWKAYKQGCDQAPAFYKQLLQFTNNLKLKIEKFCGQRANEANRLIQSIQAVGANEQELLRQRMGQYSIGSSPRSSVTYQQQYQAPQAPPPQTYRAPSYQAPSYQAPQQAPPPQYRAPQYAPYGSVSSQGSHGSNPAVPPLPSKPQQGADIYNTPSAYDPSLYSQFGNTNWNQ